MEIVSNYFVNIITFVTIICYKVYAIDLLKESVFNARLKHSSYVCLLDTF